MINDALIFSHSITSRLLYVADFLSNYYNLSFHLTSDEQLFRNANEKIRINYSLKRIIPGELFISSHGLLFEYNIHPVAVDCFEKSSEHAQVKTCKAFFKTTGDIEFDVLAAIFYLLSRYEEYLPHPTDSYGRFDPESSIAFKSDFLQLPLVNIWLEDLRSVLIEKNSLFQTNKKQFTFLPTYDIDMAWSFRNKGLIRNGGSLLKSFAQFRFQKLFYRIKVLLKKERDPYDAYEWMDQLHHSYGLNPFYFFLVSKNRSRYDRNIDVGSSQFKVLVKEIANSNSVGIHPSWASGDRHELLLLEKNTLEQIAHQQIHHSRQHYIRIQLPDTYRLLIKAGIDHDHSMGYGTINGFRASITTPFYWYDLEKEEKTNLLIHPFCFMDANSYYEQQHDPEEALDEMIRYYKVIRSVNGNMITIWHNSFLGTGKEFHGWREIYEQFVITVLTATGSPVYKIDS